MSEKVPLGGRGEYASTKSPSTHDRSAVEGGFTSSFPADRITHASMSVKGENDKSGQRQYRANDDVGKHSSGPALDRAIPRSGPYGDRAERFGTIGSGAVGPDRKGKWSNDGKSYLSTRPERESFSTDEDDSFARRYGGSGLGKSG